MLWKRSLTLLILGIACLAAAPVWAESKCKVALGGPAPELAGPDLNGAQIDLESLRGKWVYIDFWASWCKPCMKELPKVVELHRELGTRSDFAVVSFALDDAQTLKELQHVQNRYDINYPVMYDAAGWSSPYVVDWCVTSIPSTFLIDPQGRVVERDIAPHEVRGYLSRIQPKPQRPLPSVQPVPSGVFNAKHRVLKDSPSCGKPGYRDFQMSLPCPSGADPARYQLVVRTEEGPGKLIAIRYDLEFAPDASRREFPYAVTIREASGQRSVRMYSGEKSTTTGTAAEVLPGAQIAYDPKEKRLLFILPLPDKTSAASYTVARFDPAAQAFAGTLAAELKL